MASMSRLSSAQLARALPVAFALLASSASTACTTYRDQLARSQHAFEANDHERALSGLRELERSLSMLSPSERARYAYLRGMSDYRIGFRSDARHWLAIARAYDDATPGTLPTDWRARLTDALDEMNRVVHSDGVAALARLGAGDDTSATPQSK